MNEIIYILEDYDTGDMTGYWSKEAAMNAMIDFYLETGFGHLKQSIVEAAKKDKLDEVERLLDNIKEDFQTMLGDGHYIDCLMGMREVEIVK